MIQNSKYLLQNLPLKQVLPPVQALLGAYSQASNKIYIKRKKQPTQRRMNIDICNPGFLKSIHFQKVSSVFSFLPRHSQKMKFPYIYHTICVNSKPIAIVYLRRFLVCKVIRSCICQLLNMSKQQSFQRCIMQITKNTTLHVLQFIV